MIVYFTGSVSAKEKNVSNYIKIVDTLVRAGHTVIADHILKTSEEQIYRESDQEKQAFEKQVEAWIEGAHCVIAETSHPSVSVGYEIALAMQIGKPVLILHNHQSRPPSLFAKHTSEYVVTMQYSKENISSIISEFMQYVQELRDVKFTFFISPQQAHYLDKVSKVKRIPKSAYLRQLIDRERTNNPNL
jgi:hypothetical protein